MHEEKHLHYKVSLQRLAEIRDRIAAFWQWQSMDDARRNMWVSDAQEMYYQLFTAWDLHKQNHRESRPDYRAVQLTLGAARSRLEQVASELSSIESERSAALRDQLVEAFDYIWKPLAIEAGVQELLSSKPLHSPEQPVIEISGEEFHLPCAICGEIAFIFRSEIPHHCTENRLVLKGITHTTDISAKNARKIFPLLQQQNIRKVHEFLQHLGDEEGIDAYCPECDRVYCQGHYFLKEIWEAGFYDCTVSTCPEKHRRVVDD